MDETTLQTEVPPAVSDESSATEVQETVAETLDGSVTEETQETEEVIMIDYTSVIYDVGNGIMACVLFGCFMIAGILIVFKIMGGNPHDR